MNDVQFKALPGRPTGIQPPRPGVVKDPKLLALEPQLAPLAAATRPLDLPSLAGGDLKSLSGPAGAEREKVAGAAREFEEVFLRYLASAMTESAGMGGEVEGAHFYKGLIDEQFGRLLADSGRGLGLQASLIQKLGGPEEAGHGE
jgi:hypothetical protein